MRRCGGNPFQVHFSVSTRNLSATYQFLNNSHRYPEMVNLYAENLASELLSSNWQDIQERFKKKLRSFSDGEIPHAADSISALFGILARSPTFGDPPESNGTNSRTKPRCTEAGDDNQGASPHRKSMNIALIKSMHRGSFLNMEYRVRKRRIGTDQFASIYLSSTVFHGVRSKLDNRWSVTFAAPALH